MTSHAVKLDNVSRWYGNVVAVNDVSCDLQPGITGLLGPNGAGKTTILHMIAGLLAPSAGNLVIDGIKPANDPNIYKTIALVPEREAVQSFLTGREFVRMSARLQRVPNVDDAVSRALSLVDLEPAADRRIAGYSKGMRQRIKIAGALVHDPGVILLDEPFNGMDPRQRILMMELMQQLARAGCVIVISSHILEELNDLASNVLVMVAGRLAASGDFRAIRRLMTDRPHTFTIKTSNDRRFGAELMGDASVFGVELTDAGVVVRTKERGKMTRNIARLAQASNARLLEIRPMDESLESVFSYLVER